MLVVVCWGAGVRSSRGAGPRSVAVDARAGQMCTLPYRQQGGEGRGRRNNTMNKRMTWGQEKRPYYVHGSVHWWLGNALHSLLSKPHRSRNYREGNSWRAGNNRLTRNRQMRGTMHLSETEIAITWDFGYGIQPPMAFRFLCLKYMCVSMCVGASDVGAHTSCVGPTRAVSNTFSHPSCFSRPEDPHCCETFSYFASTKPSGVSRFPTYTAQDFCRRLCAQPSPALCCPTYCNSLQSAHA